MNFFCFATIYSDKTTGLQKKSKMYLWRNILCKTINILNGRYYLFSQFNYPLLWCLSATVDCCISSHHPSSLQNPYSRGWWGSLLLLLILLAPPEPYPLSTAPLSSAYYVIFPLPLLPAIEQSLMLLLPAKATVQCQVVQGAEIFHAGRPLETHLVGAII